ncbi:MAG: cyclase family protein [Thermoleophilia bacterium]
MGPILEVVDLSHELFDGMPNIGGNPVSFGVIYSFDETRTLTQGKCVMQGRLIVMPEHCGTHFDAPGHFVEGAATTAQFPLERCVLPGHLLDLTHRQRGEAITIADLEAAEERSGRQIGPGAATIVWTGADAYWGEEGYTSHRQYVPTDTATWLVERGITMFCTDLIGMDDPAEWWWPTHRIWLENDIPMVQQLCNLDRLVGREFTFVALPLPMRNGTGSPVRAVALVTG